MEVKKDPKKNPDRSKEKNRMWNNNHERIRLAFHKLIKRLGRIPTGQELQKECGLGETAIYKHIKELDFVPSENDMRVLTKDIIGAVFKTAMKGSSASQKLWFQIMEGWREKSDLEIAGDLSITVDIEDEQDFPIG